MRRHDYFCLCGRCSVGSKKVQGAPEEMEDDVIVVGFDDRGGFSYAAIFYGHAGFFFRRVSQVIFDPYKDRRQNVSEIAFYTGPIRAMSYVEPYLPDRVLRQFGLLQRIPADPIAPLRASRGQHTYDVVYEWTEGFCSSPDYHLVPEDKRERTPPGIPWVCTEDYLPWLMVFSHPRVGRGMAPIGGRVRQGREEQVRALMDVVQRAMGDTGLGAIELRQALCGLPRPPPFLKESPPGFLRWIIRETDESSGKGFWSSENVEMLGSGATLRLGKVVL